MYLANCGTDAAGKSAKTTVRRAGCVIRNPLTHIHACMWRYSLSREWRVRAASVPRPRAVEIARHLSVFSVHGSLVCFVRNR